MSKKRRPKKGEREKSFDGLQPSICCYASLKIKSPLGSYVIDIYGYVNSYTHILLTYP